MSKSSRNKESARERLARERAEQARRRRRRPWLIAGGAAVVVIAAVIAITLAVTGGSSGGGGLPLAPLSTLGTLQPAPAAGAGLRVPSVLSGASDSPLPELPPVTASVMPTAAAMTTTAAPVTASHMRRRRRRACSARSRAILSFARSLPVLIRRRPSRHPRSRRR